jgi:hypothetical protein
MSNATPTGVAGSATQINGPVVTSGAAKQGSKIVDVGWAKQR